MLLAAFSRPRASGWRPWRNLLLLSSLSCLLLLADDVLQQGFTPTNQPRRAGSGLCRRALGVQPGALAEQPAAPGGGHPAGVRPDAVAAAGQPEFLRRAAQRQDRALLEILDEQQWAPRNFVVLNLRTAHLPYAQNYRHESTPAPWPDSGAEGQANAYDNSLHYLDGLLAEILADFDRLDGERYLIITGDHGQRLGEGGHWGHNDLVPEVSDVPVIVVARDAPPQPLAELQGEPGSATTRPAAGWRSAWGPASTIPIAAPRSTSSMASSCSATISCSASANRPPAWCTSRRSS
ncbi:MULTISPECIES: sulfatase-like hydrolase/transferase [unclassified Pseudomonas]|uniref:sulfatase-like hydrolase/transferase n=1 Tax=unclassified Pseudomonas TaxID=196821 RepID=UPI0021155379|nr:MULTISPECIES: sulfatase-like hydrolase/transferase [unclassified Pseudomonas]